MSKAPLHTVVTDDVPAVTIAATDSRVVGVSPFAGVVSGVSFIPKAAITGQATNTRKVELFNRGLAGSGTTLVATIQYNSGVNAVADDENAVTLSGTAANLVVAEGDVLEWVSTAVASGLVDPGGVVRVTLERT